MKLTWDVSVWHGTETRNPKTLQKWEQNKIQYNKIEIYLYSESQFHKIGKLGCFCCWTPDTKYRNNFKDFEWNFSHFVSVLLCSVLSRVKSTFQTQFHTKMRTKQVILLNWGVFLLFYFTIFCLYIFYMDILQYCFY